MLLTKEQNAGLVICGSIPKNILFYISMKTSFKISCLNFSGGVEQGSSFTVRKKFSGGVEQGSGFTVQKNCVDQNSATVVIQNMV